MSVRQSTSGITFGEKRRLEAERAQKEKFKPKKPPAPANTAKLPSGPFKPGDPVHRLNVASVKAHALEFGYHVRRRPWENGSVHPPVIDGKLRPIKTLWQSSASMDNKILRPGPFSFRLKWPDSADKTVRLDIDHEGPLFPLFYTEEGYVYVPKKVTHRTDNVAFVKYVEFWGWNWEPTRSPPRELVYKANLKTGMHARQFETEEVPVGRTHDMYGQPVSNPKMKTKQLGPPKPREDLGIDFPHAFREEVMIHELLSLTGSAHFTRPVGFPARSDSGYLAERDEWTVGGRDRVRKVWGTDCKWSVYSCLRMFECLAKACAVMAWGSEYPDFPVEGWNQIIHLGLTQPVVEMNLAKNHGHTCGGKDVCYQISDFADALRWPAGDIVNNPWEDVDKPGVNEYRALEMKRELALKEHLRKGERDSAPEVTQLLSDGPDTDPKIKGNYGWWTNVWAIGKIVGTTHRREGNKASTTSTTKRASNPDVVVADPGFGVTDAASLSRLTHLEQSAYWRRQATTARDNADPAARLERLIDACTAENPRDRMTIPELLIEITKGLAEIEDALGKSRDPLPALHWEEDGQRILISHCHDRIRKLATSNLYSRKEIGLQLQDAVAAELEAIRLGKDSPVAPITSASKAPELEERFSIRLDDRQKWDEVVRRVFVNEAGRPAAKALKWEIGTRELSVDPSDSEDGDDEELKAESDHEIDIVYGAQVAGKKKLERYEARLGRWDISFYTG